jgi:dUTPase
MKEAIEYDSLEELYKGKKSARGSGGFGSSGEK